MDLSHYLHMQLRLEGKCPAGDDRLRQVEIVPDEDMPLMLIAQLADDQMIAYYDEALPSELHTELVKRMQYVTFPKIESLLDLLKSKEFSFEVGHYKTYIFPEQYSSFKDETVISYSKHDPKVKAPSFDGFPEQVYAIEQAGKIVSVCVSSRENDFCGEAWVFTDVRYRHQGFAKKVVSAWAKVLLSERKIPFYSHKMENIASANLANRLGLDPVFEEIVISYANV
ncbi:MAG: GNAT family N-acetyltransferase [Anaerolineae bacterium]|nr:GNAT family N-acetyltransferase [Anaerolineae bacterium]